MPGFLGPLLSILYVASIAPVSAATLDYGTVVDAERPFVLLPMMDPVSAPGEFVRSAAVFEPGLAPLLLGTRFEKNGYVSYSAGTFPRKLDEWTIEVWFSYLGFEATPCELDSCTGQPVLCPQKGDVFSLDKRALAFRLDGEKETLSVFTGDVERLSWSLVDAAFAPGSRRYVALERGSNPSEIRVYLDGRLVHRQGTPAFSVSPGAGRVVVGDLEGAVKGFSAHHLAIYDRAIGADAIATHWKSAPENWKEEPKAKKR